MNNSDSYSNKDDVASATWPDPLSAMGDYPNYPYLSVPQSTHPDLLYPSTTWPYAPDFNAADDAAFSLAPTTDMGGFTSLLAQLDSTAQVSSQCVGMSSWTYPTVPQGVLDPGSVPASCMSLSYICHDPLYSPDANPKPSST